MRGATVHSPQYLTSKMAKWVEQKVQPNVYAVTTLKQSVVVELNGSKTFIRGDSNKFDLAVSTTLGNFDRRVLKNAARRFGKVIPVATTLEGNGDTPLFHLNFLFHKPDWMPFPEFKGMFIDEWSTNSWARPILYFEERTGDCVRYSLKEGPGALLTQSTRF